MPYELKGGTSLSKGFGIIHRFSEDIDIRIQPPAGHAVKTGRNHDKPSHIESRRAYYEWLSQSISIAYEERKKQRFRNADELVAANNPAFLLEDAL